MVTSRCDQGGPEHLVLSGFIQWFIESTLFPHGEVSLWEVIEDPSPRWWPWSARQLGCSPGWEEPSEMLVGWSAAETSAGLIFAHEVCLGGDLDQLVTVAMRDGTVLVALAGAQGVKAAVVNPEPPGPVVRALRRCLGLPSGLPDPDPAVMAARLHIGILEAVAHLPQESIPSQGVVLAMVDTAEPETAEQVVDMCVRWEAEGVDPVTIRRGALVAAIATNPGLAANLLVHPTAGALVPIVSDPDGWDLVVSRVRAQPPETSDRPREWWGWADDAMIAAELVSGLPPFGMPESMWELETAGVLPNGVVELCAREVSRIANR